MLKQIAQIPSIKNIFDLLRLNLLIIVKIITPAIAVKIMANKKGSTNSVATTSNEKVKTIIKIMGGNPSRYIAKINALYTNANPISCCIMERIAGNDIMAAAIRCDFNLLKSVSGFEINFANTKAVNILHSSAGCKLNPPAIGIQLFDPLIFLPNTKVASINTIPPAYKILASAVNTLLSINKINIPIKLQKMAK